MEEKLISSKHNMGRKIGSKNKVKAAPKAPPKAQNSPESIVYATIKVLGKIYESKGSSVIEAITNLKPELGRGMSILTIQRENEQQEKILPNLITARLFSKNPLMREIALKQVVGRFSL